MKYKIVVTRLHKKYKYPLGKDKTYSYSDRKIAINKLCSVLKKGNVSIRSNISHKTIHDKC